MIKMKFALLLVLLLTFVIFCESQPSWISIRVRERGLWKGIYRYVSRWAKYADMRWPKRKRDIEDISKLDQNSDGLLEQAELEKVMGTRDAQDFLRMTTNNGDSAITTADYETFFRTLREIEI